MKELLEKLCEDAYFLDTVATAFGQRLAEEKIKGKDWFDDWSSEFTWEELCEWAKDKGAYVLEQDEFYLDYLWFSADGDITLTDGDATYFIGRERTYEQMKTIIEALWG